MHHHNRCMGSNITFTNRPLAAVDCWVGVIQDDNWSSLTVAASEYCSLDYCNEEDINVTISDPDSQCNYNHSLTLCGGCQPGLSLALKSAQCLPRKWTMISSLLHVYSTIATIPPHVILNSPNCEFSRSACTVECKNVLCTDSCVTSTGITKYSLNSNSTQSSM